MKKIINIIIISIILIFGLSGCYATSNHYVPSTQQEESCDCGKCSCGSIEECDENDCTCCDCDSLDDWEDTFKTKSKNTTNKNSSKSNNITTQKPANAPTKNNTSTQKSNTNTSKSTTKK